MYCLRRNSMLLIVFHLYLTSSLCLFNGSLHRICHRIRVHDHMTLCISCSSTDRLDQRCLRTKESFLVCIENRNKCDLRNIQPFSQKVDSHKNIEHIHTHIADDLCPLQGIDIRMKVFHPDSKFSHIIRKILCHTLRQRCDQHLIFLRNLFIHFANKIVYLPFHRTYFHLRIKKSCRTDYLLCPQKFIAFLILSRRSRDKQHLIDLTFKFFKIQRSVIQRRRKPKPIVHQSLLAGAVPRIHSPNLRNCLM